MAVQIITTGEKQTATLIKNDPVEVDVYCVPKAVELSDPSTEGCGYRGKVKGRLQRVQIKQAKELIPSSETEHLVFGEDDEHDADLMCPECGHELTPETGHSARTLRRRNLRKRAETVDSEEGLSAAEITRLAALAANKVELAGGAGR